MASIDGLPASMQAAVYLEPGRLELRQVPVPRPGPGELLARVRAAPTCGTDVKIYRRGHPKFPPPFIFGHEFGGDVVAVGAEVETFQVGQRLTANVFAECGECFYCQRGQGNLCDNLVYNFGAFAEYLIIPASIVRRSAFVIPAGVSYAQAALVEPLTTVVHAQRLLGIQPGESVAIIGAGGPIGLLHMQMALAAGAGPVIALGHSAARLDAVRRLGTARQAGAVHVFDARQVDGAAAARDLTGGRGADVVIECAGSKLAWQTAVAAARKGGRVLWFGGLSGGSMVELDATRVHYGGLTLYGTHGGDSSDARRAFELICSGAIDGGSLLSGEAPLEGLESALQRMIAGEVVKMVIVPGGLAH